MNRRDHGAEAAAGFGASAERYLRYRPAYPAMVFEKLAAATGDARARAVDLGAGSGQATGDLLRLFGAVDAVEPDARMAALIPIAPNLRTHCQKAEDAVFPAGEIDAVVAATSFHWMDQRRVLALVHDWLRPGGVFFPFLFGPFVVDGDHGPIFRAHRTRWAAYRDPRLGAAADYSISIRAHGGFGEIQSFSAPLALVLSPAEAAGLFMTASYAIAYARDHDGEAAYFGALEADFAAAGPLVSIRLPLGGVIACKTGGA